MEKNNMSSWEDLGYHTSLDDFEGTTELHEIGTKVALRTLKYHLEEEIGFELSDEAFIAIFFRVTNLRPARPLGPYSFRYGFVVPMAKILQEYKLDCTPQAIFNFFRVRYEDNRHYGNILLHIPHSSTAFPDGKHRFDDLDEEERLLIDYYTDELFVPEQMGKNICAVTFPYCRLYCDVERLPNDPLEKEGLGISYHRWISRKYGADFRSFSTRRNAFVLYTDFHRMVAKQLAKMLGKTLLIDCHSFSALPNLLNATPPDIDICIGYNDDGTRPNKVVVGNIAQHFKALGYKVGINTPFSNSKTFPAPVEYHSVMIEVNKRLYMNEYTLERTDGFRKLKNDIMSLYEILLKS